MSAAAASIYKQIASNSNATDAHLSSTKTIANMRVIEVIIDVS